MTDIDMVQILNKAGRKMNEKTNSSTLSSPWIFFAVTFGWTWLFWILAIALGLGSDTAPGIVLQLLGVIGPMVAGIAFTYLTRDKEGRRDYRLRVIDPRRIGFGWFLVVLLFVPILNSLAALLDILTGGSGATWGEAVVQFSSHPLAIIPSLLFASLIPFIEELGWRGYVLDRLQSRWNALVSSLILGVVWSLWHLPLFFIEGTYQHGLGVGTLAFWLFIAGVVPLSIPFTWIYNNTRRSTLAVILFHAMVNFTGELIALTERADTYATLLWFVAAIGITLIWGAKTLTRNKEAR
jgi:membrane protease YdiL (CAAX protease family)